MKSRKDKTKYDQDYTHTYVSSKHSANETKTASSYDKALQSTKPEHRGRKKSGSTGKVVEHTTTEKSTVRNRRSNKQHKSKHGGK